MTLNQVLAKQAQTYSGMSEDQLLAELGRRLETLSEEPAQKTILSTADAAMPLPTAALAGPIADRFKGIAKSFLNRFNKDLYRLMCDSRQHVHGELDRLDQAPDVVGLLEPRSEQHVRAGLLVGPKALDRVADIIPAADEVLRAGRDHQLDRPRMRDLDRRRDAFAGELDVIDPTVRASRVVLHRAPGQAGLEREADRLRDPGGLVGEPVLEIGRHRQVAAAHKRGGMSQCLVAGHAAVEAGERRRVPAARSGERLEAQRFEIEADPRSQAFGISSGSPGRCNSRNLLALSV